MQSHELLPLLPFLSADRLQRMRAPRPQDLAADGPRTLLLRGEELAAIKAQAKTDPLLSEGVAKLRDLADAQLTGRAPSVTHKERAPEGATLNDYCSHAIYFWPDPNSADGLPYRRRDGKVNPEIADATRFDAKRFERFVSALFVLSLAYYLTEEEAYGRRAALLLRTWFVTPKTRQTPHFRFAQGITGGPSGRADGLIEARRYLYVLDAEALLDARAGWSARDKAAFRRWFAQFDEWLRTSEAGREAAAKKNNIGLWTDLQLAAYALVLDRTEEAAQIVRDSVTRRLPEQVAADGSQPHEAARARPYDYAAFNLLAMMGMARVGEAVGFDAWWAESTDGRTYARAMDWLASAAKAQGAAPARAELDAAAEALAGQTRALEQARARAKDIEAWADELASRNRELGAKLAEIIRREGALDDERRTLQANLDARERELAREREKRAALDERLKKKSAEAETAGGDLAEARRRLETLDAAFAAQDGARRAAQERTDALAAARDKALADAERWASALQSEQERTGILVRALDAARADADRRVDEARAREDGLRVRLAEAADVQQRALESADAQRVEECARIEAQAGARIGEMQAQLAHAQAALAAAQASAEARAAELEAARAENAGGAELQAAQARARLAEQALAAALEHMARRSGEAEAAQERARAMEAALFEEVERSVGRTDTLDAKSRRMLQALKSVPPILAKNAAALAAAETRALAADAARRSAEHALEKAEAGQRQAAASLAEAERALGETRARCVELEADAARLRAASEDGARRTQTAVAERDAARAEAEAADRRWKGARAEAEQALRHAQAAQTAAADAARATQAEAEKAARQSERAARLEEKLLAERRASERNLAIARERVEKANRTINALTTSTSWRMTGPLRSAARLFRSAPSQAGAALAEAPMAAAALAAAPIAGIASPPARNGATPEADNGGAIAPPPRANGAAATHGANGAAKAKANGAAIETGAARTPVLAAGCLGDYIKSLSGSVDALEKQALRNRSLSARDLIARIATAGAHGYDELEAILETQSALAPRLKEIGAGNVHRRALAALARVVGNQAVTPNDELRATEIYASFISLFGAAKLRTIDHILHVDLLTREGRKGEARAALEASGLKDAEPDEHACLLANILRPAADAPSAEEDAWLAALNKMLAPHGLEPVSLSGRGSRMARLACAAAPMSGEHLLVSVLMTTFEADAASLDMAVGSVLGQTWRNLELIIVDDCSGAEAFARVKAWEARDPRVRVLRMEVNQGTYAAKNRALAQAKGVFATCHDSDDWSHPRKLERQAKALAANPSAIGNLSAWIRATPAMELQRFAGTGRMLYYNTSSLMYRRAAVLEKCGCYDSVRTGADSEFYRRIELAFAQKLPVFADAPLSFGQVREGALTHQTLGNGYESPDRKSYRAAWTHWHERAQRAGDALHVGAEQGARKFHAPAALRAVKPADSAARAYDVILAGDFRMQGGIVSACIDELRALRRFGLTAAICQMNSFGRDVVGRDAIDARLLTMLHEGEADQVDLEDAVQARVLLVRYPPILQFISGLTSNIRAEEVRIIASRPPAEGDGSDRRYDVGAAARHAAALFRKPALWAPTSPEVRAALAGALPRGQMAHTDWREAIDPAAWAVERTRLGDKPVIGRHVRDGAKRWAKDAAALRAAYPTDGSIVVRVLGGAAGAEKVLGEAPDAWTVLPFGAMAAKDFLASIDYFVYFPHPKRIEGSARAVVEAMAAGCVVIVPKRFKAMFGEGALYCAADEVQGLVHTLHADRRRREAQAQKGADMVRREYGTEAWAAQLRLDAELHATI